ncbi:hypothetical protein [Microscilla marina]|uniref:Uncharacterized protein n=1 Tax=Microscilla marina ATCC 23134 TaxID=313606 RepID=A1ZZV8_MICM2|nr:hypothetical protein [Microscilla marina]EAY23876.1 hypothetical protein M23134_01259 [Microscilla marina ATCC 23134]EAY24074.1 hypothetical protein M23134_02694 [Microscilla marina ATCC 23134]
MSQPQNDSPFLAAKLIIIARSKQRVGLNMCTEIDFLYQEILNIPNIEHNIKALVPTFVPYTKFTYSAEVVSEKGMHIHQYNGTV